MKGAPSWVAVHEAGHLVTARAVGVPVSACVFNPNPDAAAHVLHAAAASPEDAAAIALGGYVAQLRQYPEKGSEGCDTDFRLFRQAGRQWLYWQILARVDAIITRDWVELMILARALDKGRGMDIEDAQRTGYWFKTPEQIAHETRAARLCDIVLRKAG